MKSSRKHPQKALTTLRVNSLSVPGRYGDGNGLYLVVDPSGAKRWVLRTVVHGIRRDMGLGGLRLVSLAEARVKAQEYRRLAREGGNPIEAKQHLPPARRTRNFHPMKIATSLTTPNASFPDYVPACAT